MNIGQAAVATGVSAKMIRYYERIGLISPAHRSESDYRLYADNDVHVLIFIRSARDLGFSVESIKELLTLWQDHTRQSADVKKIALSHIARLNEKVAELQSMVDTLAHLADCCSGDERPNCPILKDLEMGIPHGATQNKPFGVFASKGSKTSA